MNEDERYMRMALAEAEEAAARGEVPVGAVVVCLGRGHNLTETLTDVTAHAEMMALTAACNTTGGKYLPDCTIYVTVEPCTMCAGALGWSHIGRIVYGADDTKRGYFSHTRAEDAGRIGRARRGMPAADDRFFQKNEEMMCVFQHFLLPLVKI